MAVPDALSRLRGALPGGRWAGLLLVASVLLLGAQLLGTSSLRRDLDSPERVSAYERRDYAVQAGEGSLVVARTRGGETVRRDLGAHLRPEPAATAVGAPILAAWLLFALLHLGAWVDAGRPAERRAVRWDAALPVLWLLPVGLSVILLGRLGVDVPAVSPSRFPSALDWSARQATAAVLAAAAIPVTALLAAAAERVGWGMRSAVRPLVPALARRLPRLHDRLPLRRYDLLLAAACGLFLATGLLGRRAFGATLSLSVGGAAVQVVELAKVLLVLHAGFLLADGEQQRGPGRRAFAWRTADPRVAKAAAASLLAAGTAVAATGDLGTALLAGAIPLLAAVAATGSAALLVGAVASGLLAVGAVLLLHRPAHVYGRVSALLAPFERSETLAGVRWALAEGGLLGTGLGSGRPQAIPNVDSDFILAAVGEELGLAGITLVLLATAALVHRGLLIAAREEDPLRKHLAAAATLAIFVQAAVITGGTLGVIPATGVPYPLVSRGGAGLVVHSALIGLLAQISVGRAPAPGALLPAYPGWLVVLRRLRATGVLALGTLSVLWGVAAFQMLARADADRDRPYVDADKVRLALLLRDGGVLVADGRRVAVRAEALPEAADGLPPELRRRVSVSGGRVDGRPLRSLAAALRVEDGAVVVPASRFSIRNPRRRADLPFRIVDRRGRPLAETRKGVRVHPYGEATFPLVGHRAPGSASGLEEDAASALQRLLRRDAALHPDRVRARVDGLLHGRLRAERPRGPWTVRSTIDRDVQRNAMDALSGHRGAAIAVDLRSGAVLALAARPSLDADAARAAGALDAAFQDEELRLRAHRGLRERYPPGSTLKLLTAAALAEAGLELAEADRACGGSDAELAVRDAGAPGGHGRVGPDEALAQSCNVWFARAGVTLGPALARRGRAFGFGEARSLVPWLDGGELVPAPSHLLTCRSVAGSGPLPDGCSGVSGTDGLRPVPEAWFAENPRLVARAAFGQTVVEATPLQMLEVVAAVASDGLRPRLHVVDRVDGRCGGGEPCALAIVGASTERALSARAAASVRRGMEAAYARGTARPGALPLRLGRGKGRYTLERRPDRPVSVGAKTGTAEVDGEADHAWFLAYAPASTPRVAVVVLVEHGGAGVKAAGPVAMRLLRDALNAVEGG